MKLKLLLISIWSFTFYSLGQAGSLPTEQGSFPLLVIPKTALAAASIQRVLSHPLVKSHEALFSKAEGRGLTDLGETLLPACRRVQVKSQADAKQLKSWVNRQLGDQFEIETDTLHITLHDDSTREPLEDRQWALHNSGSSQKVEVMDFVSTLLPGKVSEDIHLPTTQPGPLKKIRVAILDTGIDYQHPNLIPNIVRDAAECEALEKFQACLKSKPKATCVKEFSKDANGNGYPLDCSGWNVTGGLNDGVLGDHDAMDRAGHGTHVAGIIGAVANGVGIRGVSQNIELLPIKVLGESPNSPLRPRSTPETPAVPAPTETTLEWTESFADKIARGILYAIRSRADVINLSMSWPAAADSLITRKIFALAQSRGILIVASAGNDSSDARLFPCQYDGVICVASHNPNGDFSYFSNYGSFVDLAAPGMNILSTWPTKKRAINFTEREGYEIKNGTSMAAPYVAGAVATLLSFGIPPQEIHGRLLSGTRPSGPSEKFTRSGNLDIQGSLDATPRPFILPAEKREIELKWNLRDLTLPLQFSLKNFWRDGQQLTVKASLFQYGEDHAQLAQSTWTIESWPSGSTQTFNTIINADSKVNGNLDLVLVISGPGLAPQAELRIPISIKVPASALKAEPNAEVYPLVGSISQVAELRSVTSLDGNPAQDYLAIEEHELPEPNPEKKKKISIQLIAQKGNHYELSGKADFENFRGDLLVIHRINLKQDGKGVYALLYKYVRPQGKGIDYTFTFLDENLSTLMTWTHDSKVSALSAKFQWLQIRTDQGPLLVPAWLSVGMTPKLEEPPENPWPHDDDMPQMRFYYLTKEGPRTIPLHSSLSWIQLLPQSAPQAASGSVQALLSEGKTFVQTYSVALLFGNRLISGSRKHLDLKSYRTLSELDNIAIPASLNASRNITGGIFAGTSVRGELRSTWILPTEMPESPYTVFDYTHRPSSIFDSEIKLLGGFIGDAKSAVFTESLYKLHYQDLSSGEHATLGLNRFSFLPGYLLDLTRFPVIVETSDPGSRLPGILVQGSNGTIDRTEMIVPIYSEVENHLIGLGRPARLQIQSDELCQMPGNTIAANASHPTQLVYFCGDHFLRVSLKN